MSVIIAAYNNAELLSDTLKSLQAQTYQQFEAIVCDDGSSDATGEVLANFIEHDTRIKSLWKLNGGMASAWNMCWSASTGQIVCLLDSDDIFWTNKLSLVVDKARAGYGLVIHPMLIVDSNRRPLNRLPAFSSLEEGWLAASLIRRGGRWRCQPTSGISFRRELAELLFPIPEATFRMNADAFIYTLLPLLTPVGVIPQVLSEYRMHEHNATAGRRPTADVIEKQIKFDKRLVQEVNKRLRRVGRASIQLSLDRNVTFVQRAFLLDLLSEPKSRRGLMFQFFGLWRLILRDDLNATARKLVDLLAFGLAILLPRKHRSGWLWNVYGQGTGKRLAFRLFALLRSSRRLSSELGARVLLGGPR